MDWETIAEGDQTTTPDTGMLEKGRWYRLLLDLPFSLGPVEGAVQGAIWASLAPFVDVREVTVAGATITVAWVW